jgi:hypothetical protein
MGGENENQLVEFVRTFNPRSSSCLRISEGGKRCSTATVQNSDIGPCGTDHPQGLGDGIDFSCRDGAIKNNAIIGATDGGIVVFGSPGTLVENNSIGIVDVSLLCLIPRDLLKPV